MNILLTKKCGTLLASASKLTKQLTITHFAKQNPVYFFNSQTGNKQAIDKNDPLDKLRTAGRSQVAPGSKIDDPLYWQKKQADKIDEQQIHIKKYGQKGTGPINVGQESQNADNSQNQFAQQKRGSQEQQKNKKGWERNDQDKNAHNWNKIDEEQSKSSKKKEQPHQNNQMKQFKDNSQPIKDHPTKKEVSQTNEANLKKTLDQLHQQDKDIKTEENKDSINKDRQTVIKIDWQDQEQFVSQGCYLKQIKSCMQEQKKLKQQQADNYSVQRDVQILRKKQQFQSVDEKGVPIFQNEAKYQQKYKQKITRGELLFGDLQGSQKLKNTNFVRQKTTQQQYKRTQTTRTYKLSKRPKKEQPKDPTKTYMIDE